MIDNVIDNVIGNVIDNVDDNVDDNVIECLLFECLTAITLYMGFVRQECDMFIKELANKKSHQGNQATNNLSSNALPRK